MRDDTVRYIAVFGTLAVLAAAVVALAEPSVAPGGSEEFVRLIAVCGLVAGLWHLYRFATGGTATESLPPWRPGGAMVAARPEEPAVEAALSGEELSERLDSADQVTSDTRRVEDGLDVVRPLLREALLEVLVQSGQDREEAEEMLAEGTWTDDRWAGSTLDARVDPPRRSLRERVREWLFPTSAVQRRTRRAVQAIAAVASDGMPGVVGQRAPRTESEQLPTLAGLRRRADDQLQRTVDPDAMARGPATNGSGRPDDGGEASAGAGPGSPEPGDRTRDELEDGTGEAPAGDVDEIDWEALDPSTAGQELEDARRGTTRWQGAVAAAIALTVAGLYAQDPVVVLAAVVPLVYVANGTRSSVGSPAGLVAHRTVEPSPVSPGNAVRVRLAVHNTTDRAISDLRVVDGVPDDLAVTSGTPRAGVTLTPGETCTVEYWLVARRGTHEFDLPRVRLRNGGAGTIATADVPVAGETRVVCELDADVAPLEDEGDRYVGRLTADDPGRGVEFHSVREYRTDDPADRIDWRHYARRGELATVNYRRQVAASVVLVLDARSPSRVASGPGRPTGIELGAYAATHAARSLLAGGHELAVAVIGLDGPGPDGLHWLPPGSGREQRSRAQDLFERACEDTSVATSATTQVRKILEYAPPGAQIALVSPMLDDGPVTAVETWHAHGYPQVVLSPDVVSSNTVSGQLEQIRRRARLARCQSTGAWTIDWQRGTPLQLVLEYAFAADDRLASRRTVAGGAD